MKRKYLVGTDDFKEFLSEGALFLDKTAMIGEFLEGNKVVLVTRPRRFGKSLNISMLRYFLDIREQSQDLFKGLSVSKDAETMEHMNKYPVIHISFKGLSRDGLENSIESVMDGIKAVIAAEYQRHSVVKEILRGPQLARYEEIEAEVGKIGSRLWNRSLLELSQYLEKYYGQKVVVLVDEYDSPMYNMYGTEGFEGIMGFFGAFYENALKGNTFLKRGFMTGIMRVAKEGIFSGLNNVDVHTILSEKYREYFGFTEEEIKPLIEEEGLSMGEAKQWYNGYNFGGNLIYNPWSVMNYLDKRKAAPYWENTSNNQLIKELVKKGGPEIKYRLELLLKDEPIELEVRENVNLRELVAGDIWSLFLQAGYITCEEKEEKRVFRLPNKEVRGFIAKMLEEVSEQTENKSGIEEALKSGNWKKFEEALRDSVLQSVSYYDVQRGNVRYNESFYHSLLLGIFITMGAYEVRSNRESGLGRADIVLKRKDGKGVVIIELKAGNQYREMGELLEEAEEQMRKKRYGEDLKGHVTKLAIAFKGKEVSMKEVTE